MSRAYRVSLLVFCLALLLAVSAGAEVKKAQYKGWSSLSLDNGIIEVQVVPEIGGRVIQLRLGDFEYLWVNEDLAGKSPTPTRLTPDGGWLNYGGDKIWPAPQGWDSEEMWPGPPDAVLDGGPYAAKIVSAPGKEDAVELVSEKDKRSGIQFSRVIRVHKDAARVSFDTTMTNVDTKPRRWGIWQVTQLNAANRQGEGYNKEMRCYSPVNPKSVYRKGYVEMFGLVNNPSFSADAKTKMAVAHYQRLVGKMGADNSAGWVATVDGTSGYVFVERFRTFPGKKYPDDTAVTFWMSGVGQYVAGTKIVDSKDDPKETPYLVESEVVSPFAELKPGESYSFHNEWMVARIGGNFPVLDCTPAGVVCEPLVAKVSGGKVVFSGRFGFFQPGRVSLVLADAKGAECGRIPVEGRVSPKEPLVLKVEEPLPAGAASVRLMVESAAFGKGGVALAKASIAK